MIDNLAKTIMSQLSTSVSRNMGAGDIAIASKEVATKIAESISVAMSKVDQSIFIPALQNILSGFDVSIDFSKSPQAYNMLYEQVRALGNEYGLTEEEARLFTDVLANTVRITEEASEQTGDYSTKLEELTKAYKSAYDSLSKLESIQEKLNEAGQVTPEIFNEIAESFPELITQMGSYESAQGAINNKINDFAMIMGQSYANAIGNTQSFWEEVIKIGNVSNSTLATLAGVSAKNFANMEGSKAKAAAIAAQSASSVWAQYFGQSASAIRSQMNALRQIGIRSSDSTKRQTARETYNELKAILSVYESIGKIKISSASTGGGGGSSETEKATEDVKTYIEALKEQFDIQEDIYEQEIDLREAAIDTKKTEIDAQEKLLDALDEEYDKEDKLLRLQQEREKLANIRNERNVRLYNATTGKFDWVADPRALREQEQVVADLEREMQRDAERQAIQDVINSLEAQKEAEQGIIDQLKAKQDLLKEFISDIGLLDDEVQKNIISWQQLLEAMGAAGIAHSDVSPAITPIQTAPSSTTPTPASTPASNELPASQTTGILKKGSKGENVKAIQRALLALGYYAGSIDGIFGSATHKATVAFQKAAGLISSSSSKNAGVIGDKTRSAFAAKGFEKGGAVDYTGLAMVHGSPLKKEYMYSAPNVESIMGSVPALLAQMANGGGITFTGDISVSANSPDDFIRQMKNRASLSQIVGRR
jgi:hypothetical protein